MESAVPARVDPHHGACRGSDSGCGCGSCLHLPHPLAAARHRVGADRAELRTLLGPKLWRGHEQAQIRAEPTGYAELDRVLPGGGWPLGAVSEVLHARTGVGELSLALPLLARLTQAGRKIALVAPPCLPYAPRLAAAGIQLAHLAVVEAANPVDALWSTELLLRAGAGSVLLWATRCELQSLRRLQLAAESGDGCLLVYRPETYAAESTPSALRLRVWRDRGSPCVEVLKCRGLRPAPISLRAAA
jgi:protein ImuA